MPEQNGNTPAQTNAKRRRRAKGNRMVDTLDAARAALERPTAGATRSALMMRDAEHTEAMMPNLSSSSDVGTEALAPEGMVREPNASQSELPTNAEDAIADSTSQHQPTGHTNDRDPDNAQERWCDSPNGLRSVIRSSEAETVKMSTRLPINANRLLKAIAIHEGAKLADVVRDMMDRDLARRGFPTIEEMAVCTDAEVNDLVGRAAAGSHRSAPSD